MAHTAALDPAWFDVEIGGQKVAVDDLLPEMGPLDRFGIVVHDTLGALGANLLIQAATAHSIHVRKASGLRAGYPEIYAFHVGRDHGDLSAFDFWPAYKETVVASSAVEVMHAINARGITRLAVPSGPVRPFNYMWPEKIEFEDRVRTVVEYDASGQTAHHDVVMAAEAAPIAGSTDYTLDIFNKTRTLLDHPDPDTRRWIGHVGARLSVLTEGDLTAARDGLASRVVDGRIVETYRVADVPYALGRLVP